MLYYFCQILRKFSLLKIGLKVLKTNTVHYSGLRGCKSASADTNHPNDTSRKQEDSPLRIALADKTANSMLANPLLMASLNRWLHLWSFKAFFWKWSKECILNNKALEGWNCILVHDFLPNWMIFFHLSSTYHIVTRSNARY